MLDFTLDDWGDLQFKELGEETRDVIYEVCYPQLSELLHSGQLTLLDDNSASEAERETAEKLLADVVVQEKKRLLDAETPVGTAKTERGKEIQQRLGASSVVADQLVDNSFEAFHPKGEKPN